MSFFSELKRRNVVRVATAYLVGSWLIIQVAEATFPAFGLSDAALRLVIILLAIALIPTLIFSWVFEITPEGLRREVEVIREHSITRFTGKKIDRIIMLLLALALAVFAFDTFILDPVRDREIAESAAQEGAERAREEVRLARFDDKSVAVLPFANRSPVPADAYFADGLHDELLTQLGRISALRVISRTSVEQYRNTEKSTPEIARELSVATVLEGGVQRSGNQVRINVQLIDARSDEHLWAATYDRELTAENLFAIQSEVTASIAEALDAELTPQQQRQLFDQPTADMQAYELYLLGRSLMASRNTEDLRQALQSFEQAVNRDAQFAQAWLGIADSNMMLRSQGAIERHHSMEVQKQAVEKALALNDQLGEAYASLAMILWRSEPEKTDAAFRRAFELSPSYAPAYMWYANFLLGAANFEQKLALYFKAAELDPLSPIIRHNIAGLLVVMGRDDEALEQYERLLQLDHVFAGTYADIGGYHASNGRLAEAMKWYREAQRLDPESGYVMGPIVDLYVSLGDLDSLLTYRKHMAEVLAPDSFRLLVTDYFINMMQSGWQAALMLESLPEAWAGHPVIAEGRALAYLIGRRYPEAYENFLQAEPAWADQEQWPRLIEEGFGACYAAGIFIKAGEVDSGRELLRQSLHYLEVELPKYVQHPDRFWNLGVCYLLDGRHDEALDFFEQYVDDGHWGDWHWFYVRHLPYWDPLREHPRYIALMRRVEERKAVQRELIRRLDEPPLPGSP